MRRVFSAGVLAQVGLLTVSAVIASQLVTASLIVFTPRPRPPGFTIAAATAALRGLPARTSDDRPLHREVLHDPPFESDRGPLGRDVAQALARRLNVDTDDVRVHLTDRGHRGPANRPGAPFREGGGSHGGMPPGPMRFPSPRQLAPEIDPTSNQVTLPPMEIAVRKQDEWVLVRPPRSFLTPWQTNILLGMAISLILLAPLIWWMARRLAAPIHRFAKAAESFGANPDTPPLPTEGPAEVRVATSAFNHMQARLRDHIRQRTQTVAAIAHDVRTPLTRLRFRAEQAPPAQRDAMAADIEEIDTLISEALDFARDDPTASAVVRVDLGEIVQRLVEGYRATGAAVSFVSTESPVAIMAEPTLLRRGLANLIDNGLFYGEEVEVRLAKRDRDAELRILDRGPGIPEDRLSEVFEPFVRLEASRNRRTGGMGLGLAIARQAARTCKGDIALVNRPAGGLEVVFTIPALA